MTHLDAVLDRARHPDGIHRDQYKRPIIYTDNAGARTKCNLCEQHIAGEPYQRMTTFIDVLEDKSGLHKYDLRQVVKGMAMRSDLVLWAASEIDNVKTLGKVAAAAQEAAGSSSQATSGTAVHTFTEAIDRGEYPLIPPQVEADVAAYQAALLREQLTPELVECHIVIDGLRPTPTCGGISGKFDRLYSRPWPCPGCGSRYVIGDVKTGKLDYNRRKFPMQLAGYAAGKLYNPRTGERAELGACQCWAAVIHMPVGAGVARVEWANLIGARGGLAAAYTAWQWRQVDGLMVPSPNQPQPPQPPSRGLDDAVSVAPPPLPAPPVPAPTPNSQETIANDANPTADRDAAPRAVSAPATDADSPPAAAPAAQGQPGAQARGLDDVIPLARPSAETAPWPAQPALSDQATSAELVTRGLLRGAAERPAFRSACDVCPPDSEVLACPQHGGAALHSLIEIAGDLESLTSLRNDAGGLWNPMHTVHAQRRMAELNKATFAQSETSEETTSDGANDETGEPGPLEPLLVVPCPHCEADAGEPCRTPTGGRARAGKSHKKRLQAFNAATKDRGGESSGPVATE